MTLSRVLYSISHGQITHNGVVGILSKELKIIEASESSCHVETELGYVSVEYFDENVLGKHVIVISVNSMDQELVCCAWDILLSIFNDYGGVVWLSTYSSEYLSRFGDVVEIVLAGVSGQAMNSMAFSKLIG